MIILCMAILLGTNFKDATWLNSDIAAAEANRVNTEVAHQQAVYQLQERLAAATTEAEINQIQREQEMLDAQYAYDKQILSQDVINRQLWTETIITLVIYIGSATGIAAGLSALILSIAKAIVIVKSISSEPKAKTIANQYAQKPLKDYYREYLDIKYENRDLKHTNQKLNTQNEHLVEVNQKLATFCQSLAAEKEELVKEDFDVEEFIKSMKAHRHPAKTIKGDYKDKPLAGD